FDGLERLAREAAQARFQRGQITVGVQARRAEAEGAVRINTEALDRYLAMSAELVAEAKAEKPAADGLLALRGVIETGEGDEDPEARATVEKAMGESLAAAFDALKASRLQEGASLKPLLSDHVSRIEGLVGEAETEAGAQTAAIRDRFT